MDKKRNVAIDLLRVIAATLIVLHHYQQGVDITFEHIKFYGGTFCNKTDSDLLTTIRKKQIVNSGDWFMG